MRDNQTTVHGAIETPLQPRIARPDALRLAADEYARVADAVAALAPGDWERPTECTEWTVHQLVSHVVGMATMASSPFESRRQMRIAEKRPGGEAEMVDALTALQVREFGRRTPAELVADLYRIGPKAAKGRRRTPGFLRRRAMAGSELVNGEREQWTLGYLIDVVLTRDPWMHRIDLSRATGRPLALTADHDGRIIDDVVREWAARHGKPYRLTLTGPAGGTWTSPDPDGEAFELDAIEFCRALSGRGSTPAPFDTQVPF
ncbi:maleylpyruvate isomerase family mycothiol-dependent enzyme [Nocardia sp. NPDC059764]|uniref:maleylpyruvate isomerase family mycothiol-dependent enzyme n=1 Tax=Nocardia sp. NPDC059764 TaxID=3346939 RepID=UPI0036553341